MAWLIMEGAEFKENIFFFKQKTAYEIGLGIPAEPLFRSRFVIVSIFIPKLRLILILNSFLGSSDSLVFSELFHSLAPRPLAARSISDLFVLITLLNVTLIILTLSVSRLLNLLLRLVAFLLFLNPQCLASISRWITASSSWKRFCLFVCRALSSIMVICMLTAIRLLLTFVMSLYLLLRS